MPNGSITLIRLPVITFRFGMLPRLAKCYTAAVAALDLKSMNLLTAHHLITVRLPTFW